MRVLRFLKSCVMFVLFVGLLALAVMVVGAFLPLLLFLAVLGMLFGACAG